MLPRTAKTVLLVCLCLVPATTWAETHFEAAQRLIESGHETEARRSLELELKLRPRNLEARFNLAVLLMRIDHRDDAMRLYQANMKHGWHLPTVANLSAMYLKQGKRKAAIHLLEQSTRKFRAEAVPWYLLAAIAEKTRDTKKAAQYYLKALKADRKNGFAHIRYARFLAKQHHLKTARKHADRAVHLLPKCAPCFKIEGDILRQSRNKKPALAAYQKAASLSPGRAIRLDIIAMLNAIGEHRRARIIKQALKAESAEHAP